MFCVCSPIFLSNPIVFGRRQRPKKSQEFNKVAECFCGNGVRLHYALVEVNAKQISRRLETNDLAIAKRRMLAKKTTLHPMRAACSRFAESGFRLFLQRDLTPCRLYRCAF
jgi:hypothetical protein